MTNPELAAARASVPEIADAERKLQAAKVLLADAPHAEAPDAAREAVIAKAAEDFLSGVAWPKDLGKRAAKAYDEADAVLVDRQARQLAVQQAEWAVYEAVELYTEDALAFLGTRLEELLSDARTALETVGSVNTADAAIEAGVDVVAAWSRLQSLVRDVHSVREAQWTLLRGPKIPGAPAGGDWPSRQWMNKGFGHVRGLHPDEAPEAVRAALRDRRVTLDYLRWIAARDDGYVPSSESALEGDVALLTTPISFDDSDRLVDMSPVELPPRPTRPAEVYPHSTTPHMDYSQPVPNKPKPNATVADAPPYEPSYF
ncbi:hypothetical protein ACFV3F_09440 [Streptomyces sp. NPDC059717]|uniref:hypothetical protein n=1 Tax=Streptomyces sp. NPDC059717 TaxID=3346922 RepID=UPI0036ABBFE8